MVAALKIETLRKVYGSGFEALKGISMDVQQGDFFALLGPNGAGKSTTIGIICSLVSKSGGSVSVYGIDIDRDFPGAKKNIGIVPQEFNFNMFEKVGDIVVNQAGYYGLPRGLAAERAEKYLRELGLWEKRDTPSRMLSGGMKRRLMIARALVHEPRLLILDEPTAGVDIEMRRSMWDFLKKINEAGTTIILTTHYLEEAEALCRNIAIINNGEIVEHTSIRDLLRRLHREVFIVDSADVLPADRRRRWFLRAPDRRWHTRDRGRKGAAHKRCLCRPGCRRYSRHQHAQSRQSPRGDVRQSGGGCGMSVGEQWIALMTLLRKEVRRFLRIWPQTLLPSAITMSLYFVIFGSLIGARIGQMGGFDYMEFVVPGLIMMAIVTNSYSNVVSSFFGAKFNHSIEELLVSPTPNYIILLGFILGGITRGLLVAFIVTCVSLFFTQLPIYSIGIVIGVVVLPPRFSPSQGLSTPCLPIISTISVSCRPLC